LIIADLETQQCIYRKQVGSYFFRVLAISNDGSVVAEWKDTLAYIYNNGQSEIIIDAEGLYFSEGVIPTLGRFVSAKTEDFGGNKRIRLSTIDFAKGKVVDSLFIEDTLLGSVHYMSDYHLLEDGTILIWDNSRRVHHVGFQPLTLKNTIEIPQRYYTNLEVGANSEWMYIIGPGFCWARMSLETGEVYRRSALMRNFVGIEVGFPTTYSAMDHIGYKYNVDLKTGIAEIINTDPYVHSVNEYIVFSSDTFAIGGSNSMEVRNSATHQSLSRASGYDHNFGLGWSETRNLTPLHHYPNAGTMLFCMDHEEGVSAVYHNYLDLGFLPTVSDTVRVLKYASSILEYDSPNGVESFSTDSAGGYLTFAVYGRTYFIKVFPQRKSFEVLRFIPNARRSVFLKDGSSVILSGTTGLRKTDPYFDLYDHLTLTYKYTEPLAEWDPHRIVSWMDDNTMSLINIQTDEVEWSTPVPDQIDDIVLDPSRKWIAVLLKNGIRQLYAYKNATSITDTSPLPQRSIRIVPNPAHDIIRIEHAEGASSIVIVNAIGEVIKAESTLSWDGIVYVTDIPAGAYYAVLEAKGSAIVLPFVKIGQ